jgi:hypothetical protein
MYPELSALEAVLQRASDLALEARISAGATESVGVFSSGDAL